MRGYHKDHRIRKLNVDITTGKPLFMYRFPEKFGKDSHMYKKLHYFYCKIRKMMNTYTAVAIYKSHLLSFMEYGAVFLDYLPQNLKIKLQRCQNKCLSVSHMADRYTSNLELHTKCKILLLRYRRKLNLCAMMYKRIEHHVHQTSGERHMLYRTKMSLTGFQGYY